jgi:hypothetical protein
MSSIHSLPFPGASGDLSCREPHGHSIDPGRRSADRLADIEDDLQDDLRPARGVGAGVAIGVALWILLIAAGWLIFG